MNLGAGSFTGTCPLGFSVLFQKNGQKEFLFLTFYISEAENPCEE